MVEMMECPSCGASNSVKRQTCYSCQAPLHQPAVSAPAGWEREGTAVAPPQATPPAAGTCAMCAHGAVFPPPGVHIQIEEVYCTKHERPVVGCQPGGECYEQAFTWRRTEIVD